jgi:inorganic pyrophosphatase
MIRDLRPLEPQLLREVEHFFESYNRAQGREFRIVARAGRRAAEAVLLKGLRLFARQTTG